MGSMSRRLSRTLINASLTHGRGARRRFASSSVRTLSSFIRGESELPVTVRRHLRRQGHPLSEPFCKAQTSHRGAHAEVRLPTICAAYLVSYSRHDSLRSRHNLSAAIDPQNSGVLIVQLDGGTAAEQVRDRGGIMLGTDDITRRLDRKDESCIIM